jgi:hypothetical protein
MRDRLEHSRGLRSELLDAGARYIICFFDENSLDRWDSFASHDDATSDYIFLLSWLMEDQSLGIIAKPKKPSDLLARIAGAASLLERASDTGRWRLIRDLDAATYPAHIARAADLSVGRLGGLTASLEARLAGVPSVLVDAQGLRDHPFYAWGHGSVVFTDWAELRNAVEKLRADGKYPPGFGDWTPALEELGAEHTTGSRRMARYLIAAFDALRSGGTREDALRIADGTLGDAGSV